MYRRILLSLAFALPLAAADPHLTPEERAKVLAWLDQSRTEFLAAIDGVSAAQWTWKSDPSRWSIAEVAEHVVLAEASQFGKVKTALSAPADAAWETKTRGKTEMIEMVMAPRLGRATAPEPLVPGGKLSQSEIRQRFERQHQEIVQFARETQAPLKEHLAAHPMQVFDPLNAWQWLIYAPLHTLRHVKQIAEVKASPGYPH